MLQGSPDPPPSSGLQLRVTQGAAAGKVYPLDAETLSVGRSSPGVESVAGFLSIDDDTVSRLHAELRWDAEQGAYILTNRSVTNPTTVNHVLVESARLQPGDVIVMGECVCVLQPQASVSQRSERPRSGASGTLALTDRPPLFLESVAGNRHPILADWVQHIPRARQHQVTYAGHFANALGNLNPKPDSTEETHKTKESKPSKWVKWRTLILRCWAIDPELCPKCGKEMKRSKALREQHQLQRLLKSLGIGLYPVRPRSPPPPDSQLDTDSGTFSDCDSQIPTGWDDWEAA